MFPLRHPIVPLLAAMCLSFGCSAVAGSGLGMVSVKSGMTSAGLRAVPAPVMLPAAPGSIPGVMVSRTPGPAIVVNLPHAASPMTTKAVPTSVASDITFFRVELIQDQGAAAGTDYTDATLGSANRILGSVFFDGPSATVVTGGTVISDGGNNGLMAFQNVPTGTYRVRVKAFSDATTAGTTVISKPDGFFTNASLWTISSNTATVPAGNTAVTYSANSALQVPVSLKNGGDNIQVGLTVFNGTTLPITSSDN